MSQFADIRVEWRVADIERSLTQKADKHEISAVGSDVDRMEHTLRTTRAEITELRSQLESQSYEIQRLTDICNGLIEKQLESEVKRNEP